MAGWLDKYQEGGEIDAVTSESAPYWQIPIKQRQDFKGNFLYNRLSGKEGKYAKQPDLVRYYGGRPLEGDYLKHSQYKPSVSENPNAEYIAIDSDKFREDIINRYNENINDTLPGGKLRVKPDGNRLSGDLGNFTIGKGNDEKGQYLSYYDIYNYTRDDNPDVNKSEWLGAVKPYEIYDRIYVEKNEEGKYVPKKFAKGGNVSYTPEYIDQLKRFENRPDNLAYHLDNKKIPTIGWGHRITEEELKRKAIKMGKEWVPYEKFSGKEGRQYADRLMELDVAHHYNRLERQVGKDTLATLPPEVHDVLLDITYNRGSLGDSLEYVKSGDIAGLRNYLAETSKGLKGGAKTRMEWRANRIPVKTLPPVEAPINYNIENQYVPEVLQSIAEQPSTQSIIPIQDNEGYRNQENYGKPVQITSNQSRTPISMEGVPFPILAVSDTGELKIMFPGEEHTFEGGSVTELPMAQQGDIIKSNQLRTFTEDNGWLNKYKEQ